MKYEFRWNEWNLDHATKHGVAVDECESVVNGVAPPYPEQIGNDKLRVRGQTPAGRFVQVIYVLDPDGTVYVIHARPLTDHEKRQFRRRMR